MVLLGIIRMFIISVNDIKKYLNYVKYYLNYFI